MLNYSSDYSECQFQTLSYELLIYGKLFAMPDNDVFLGFTFVLSKRRTSRSLEFYTKTNSSPVYVNSYLAMLEFNYLGAVTLTQLSRLNARRSLRGTEDVSLQCSEFV